jgi:hypothetical protein
MRKLWLEPGALAKISGKKCHDGQENFGSKVAGQELDKQASTDSASTDSKSGDLESKHFEILMSWNGRASTGSPHQATMLRITQRMGTTEVAA